MRTSAIVSIWGLALLGLGACKQKPSDPPLPLVVQKPADPAALPAAADAAASTSVPAAGAVQAPATETRSDPAAGRSNRAMTAAQESSAMPMPGQNNDHSAPLPPASAASGR